jgi:hypothetical protein
MGGLVVTCAKCGMRRAFHGNRWEIAVESEVWLKRHQRAKHQGVQVKARGSTATVPPRIRPRTSPM